MASATPPGLNLSLTGKVALVTGGSRGIGAATVRLLRQAGARVVFSYRSAEEQARALVEECGGEEYCRAIQQDLASVHDGHMLVVKTYAAFKQLDILIVNHGVWPPHDQPFATMEMNQWYDTLEVNLNSVFGLAQAAVGLMLPYSSWAAALSRTPDAAPLWDEAYKAAAIGAGAKPYGETPYGPVTPDKVRGHIVLVASTAAQRGEAFHADYAASKGALLSLTKSLSSELGPQGILCNCVAPGWVRTDMSAGTLSDPIASKKDAGPDSAWPRRRARRDCRADRVSLQSVGRFHLRRDLEHQRRRCPGRVTQEAREEIRDARDN